VIIIKCMKEVVHWLKSSVFLDLGPRETCNKNLRCNLVNATKSEMNNSHSIRGLLPEACVSQLPM
jgi:hypothetical protein